MIRAGFFAHRESADADPWDAMSKGTKRAAGSFLQQRIGISEFRIFSAFRTEEKIEALGWLPVNEFQRALQGSGVDGMNVRPFNETDADRMRFRVIVMEGKTRQEVQAAADYLGDKAFGIVHTRRGWAIRVTNNDYSALVHQVNPEEAGKLTAQYFEVSGFPNSFSKAAVRTSLAEWQGSNQFELWIEL